jgi:predicted dinucleotide-binding enzyme
MATIGFIGSGNIGSQLARLAVADGYDVVMSNSRGPETLTALITELGAKARAATVVDAAKAGDMVVVTIPLKHYRTVPVEPLAGKVVIDTMNYYPSAMAASRNSTTSPPRPRSSFRRIYPPRRSSRRSTTFTQRSLRPMGGPPAPRIAAHWSSPGTTQEPKPR